MMFNRADHLQADCSLPQFKMHLECALWAEFLNRRWVSLWGAVLRRDQLVVTENFIRDTTGFVWNTIATRRCGRVGVNVLSGPHMV